MVSFSHNAPITPLRQRMQEDMVMRGLGSHTQQDYIRHVRRFAAFLGRAPDTATVEDIRRYQLYQHENGVGPATINSTVMVRGGLAVGGRGDKGAALSASPNRRRA